MGMLGTRVKGSGLRIEDFGIWYTVHSLGSRVQDAHGQGLIV
jgi:hypothetical protein